MAEPHSNITRIAHILGNLVENRCKSISCTTTCVYAPQSHNRTIISINTHKFASNYVNLEKCRSKIQHA